MTIKEKITIIEAMLNNKREFYNLAIEENEQVLIDLLESEISGIDAVLTILRDNDFAQQIKDIYVKED